MNNDKFSVIRMTVNSWTQEERLEVLESFSDEPEAYKLAFKLQKNVYNPDGSPLWTEYLVGIMK